jgi:[ribosomal protein S5]-alanine N-acetyltransferase
MKINNPIILESNMLILKELRLNNVTKEYVGWLNDVEVNKYLESRFVTHNERTVREFVENCAKSNLKYLFGIFIKSDMRHIGNIKLGPINTYHNYAEVGLMIGDKDSWGKGFASEAISMVTQFGLNQLDLDKLSAGCYESNIGSKKSFEKSGYKVEGLMRNQVNLLRGRENVWKVGCIKSDLKD